MSTKPAAWRGIREEWRAARAEAIGEMRAARDEAIESWREMTAEIRQDRQITRRMWQRITGKPNPTRRERRDAERAILAEADEIEETARRVLREHRESEGPGAAGRNPG